MTYTVKIRIDACITIEKGGFDTMEEAATWADENYRERESVEITSRKNSGRR